MKNHTIKLNFDEYYMRVMVNCALGMMNDVEFGKMFKAVETNSQFFDQHNFEITAEQIAAISLFLIAQLTDGDKDGVNEVLDILSRKGTLDISEYIP